MSRYCRQTAGTVFFLVALSTLVVAGQPDPANCTWDDWVGVSPQNNLASAQCQYKFTGTLRDGAGVPIADFPAANLELDFTDCVNQPNRPLNQMPADENSDPNGEVLWMLNLDFGGADPCEVRVLVQNVVFKTLAGHQGLTTGPETPPCVIDGGVRSCTSLPDLAQLQCHFFAR